jgi:hypothetical protein
MESGASAVDAIEFRGTREELFIGPGHVIVSDIQIRQTISLPRSIRDACQIILSGLVHYWRQGSIALAPL